MNSSVVVTASSDRLARYTRNSLLIVFAFVSVYTVRTADPDLWGHLRYGRFFVEAGLPPIADPFSYYTTDTPWIAHEYLAQIVLWQVYAVAGPAGLIALKCAVGLATLLLVYGALRLGGAGPRIWAPAFILVALLLSRYLLFRPQMFTYLGLSAFAYLLLRRLVGRRSPLWLLPPLLAFWANLHGGFLAGIGLVGIVLGLQLIQGIRAGGVQLSSLWRFIRATALALAGCVGASFLTPFGWRIWPLLWTELGNGYNRRFIEEWQPIRLAAPGLDGALILFLVGLLAAAWLAGVRRARDIAGLRPWHWLLSCLPFMVLVFASRRHIPLLVLWATPVLCLIAQAAWEVWPASAGRRRMALVLTGLILLPAFASVYVTLADPLPRIRINAESLGADQPFGAVAFLCANRLSGNLYLPLWWGSYVTWELYPAIKVSMDGRNDTVYPVSAVGANLEFYAGVGDPETPLHSETDYLLIPASAAILPAIRADSRWLAIYEDAGAVLFLKNDVIHTGVNRLYRSGELIVPAWIPPEFFW